MALIKISSAIIRSQISSRGGGLEIDLTKFGFENEKMAVYQNYLGGGILGSISVNNTLEVFDKPCTDKQKEDLKIIGVRLKKYYYKLQNGSLKGFAELQKRATSAY